MQTNRMIAMDTASRLRPMREEMRMSREEKSQISAETMA